jgi:hypothetical protein
MLPDVPTIGEFVPGYEATAWARSCEYAAAGDHCNFADEIRRAENISVTFRGRKLKQVH